MARDQDKRVLVVEDDQHIEEIVRLHFSKDGFHVTSTPDGDDALVLVEETRPDIVILDWMIEGTSGIEVCRRIRRNPKTADTAIMILTARGEESDKLRGLETGADDFITKPFSPKELVARARALLRRTRPSLLADKLSYAGIELDVAAHRVRRNGQTVALSPTEYRLLRHFLENPEKVYSRQQLLDVAWPHNEDIELRTVDVHIRRLRVALGGDGGADLIRTVRSEGYSLDAAIG
ncbi:MAG TPA: phosphate regulon transcriptional regulator PhoB [Sphingomicrobium sp.]|nr:phosphate regulon transcriptional regulator PhoB [Sphingomicrobium sp.]